MLRERGLQFRFVVALLLTAGVFATLASGLAYQIGFDRALRTGAATLDGLANAILKTASIGAYTTDTVLLKEVVDGLSRSPLVASVDIRDVQGHLVVSSDHGLPDSPPPLDSDTIASVHRLLSPFDASDVVGTLTIRGNMAVLKASARSEATVLALLMFGQTVAVALLLYQLAARLVSRPILRMADTLRTLKPGTPQRLPVPAAHRHDEIGGLIASANELLQANETALVRERLLRADIERMEAQYRRLFDASSAGIFVLSADRHLINCNPTVIRLSGLTADTVLANDRTGFLDMVFSHPATVHDMIDTALSTGQTVSADLALRRAEQGARWVHCLISVQSSTPDRQEEPHLVEGVIYDITDRKHAEGVIRHRADHDALTGLKNRASSDAAIDRMLVDANRDRTSLSLLYIDLDGFKQINDTLGHKAGDTALTECARRMRQEVRRGSDLCARIGGDEFVVVLQHTGPSDANLAALARNLVDTLSAPIELEDGHTVHLGASIGMACYPQHGGSRKQLLHLADTALYEVKRTGKNSFAMTWTG